MYFDDSEEVVTADISDDSSAIMSTNLNSNFDSHAMPSMDSTMGSADYGTAYATSFDGVGGSDLSQH